MCLHLVNMLEYQGHWLIIRVVCRDSLLHLVVPGVAGCLIREQLGCNNIVFIR